MRRHNVWVVLQPAESVPGQWTAHCLDYDVITQGNSLRHALEMAVEAITMVVEDDVARGVDPRERRAPEEEWNALWRSIEGVRAEPFSRDLALEGIDSVVVHLEVGGTETKAPGWRAPLWFEHPASTPVPPAP